MPFLAFCVQCVRSRTGNLRTPKPAVDKNETTLASPYNNSPKFDFTPFESLSLPIFLSLTLLFSFTFFVWPHEFCLFDANVSVCNVYICQCHYILFFFSFRFRFISFLLANVDIVLLLAGPVLPKCSFVFVRHWKSSPFNKIHSRCRRQPVVLLYVIRQYTFSSQLVDISDWECQLMMVWAHTETDVNWPNTLCCDENRPRNCIRSRAREREWWR